MVHIPVLKRMLDQHLDGTTRVCCPSAQPAHSSQCVIAGDHHRRNYMLAINDTGDDVFVLVFSDDPPRVRDTINPFTLLSWNQSGGDLSVNSYVIDDAGEAQERCMKVKVLPNNAHVIRTLEGWLPSGIRVG
jgi:hypothetical protein